MFQVFEDGKPADTQGYPIVRGSCWENSKFETFDEAVEYAHLWALPVSRGELNKMCFAKMELNKPISLGQGAMMEIREV